MKKMLVFLAILCLVTIGSATIEITNLHDNQTVQWMTVVDGNFSDNPNTNVYLFTRPVLVSGDPWWVQQTKTFKDGTWEAYVYFGRDPEKFNDKGIPFQVIAIVTPEELNDRVAIGDLSELTLLERTQEFTVIRS